MTRHPDGDEPVTLLSVASPFEAQMMVAVLQQAGIQAEAIDRVQTGRGLFEPAQGAVMIRVRQRDVDAARRALQANAAAAKDIDWDSFDVGERADELPLRKPGRVPPIARAAAVVVAVMLLAGVIAWLATWFTP